MLDIPFRVELADIGDGLLPRAESPLAARAFRGRGQGPRVRCLRLCGELRGMAGLTGRGAGVLAHRPTREAQSQYAAREVPQNLPDESAAVLELTPVDSGLLRRDASKGGSAGYAEVWIGPAKAVGDVVAFQPQLELDPFLDGEIGRA